MKKIAAIFGIIFAVSLVCFCISVAATGITGQGPLVAINGSDILRFGNWAPDYTRSYTAGETTTDNFSENVNNIKIEIASAKTTVKTADTDTVTVNYTAGKTGMLFGASVKDGTLRVSETGLFFMMFSLGNDSGTLDITLPEKNYGNISFSVASGSVSAGDLTADKFHAEVASGNGDYRVFAKDIDIDAASGSINLTNCTENKVNSLKIGCASGSHNISGYKADSFRIDTASGGVKAYGISGEGKIDIASGSVTLEYAEWDGSLNIDAASGIIDVKLPEGSGAAIDLDAMSGSVKFDLDGQSGSFSGDNSGTVGGANVHEADVDLASGSVKFHN